MKNISLVLTFFICFNVNAQKDTTGFFNFNQGTDTLTTIGKRKTLWNKENIIKASIAPAILITYGIAAKNGWTLYDDDEARRDILRQTGGRSYGIDDYLIFAPFVELALLNVAKINCKNDL